jgi:hypothetical protein
MFGRYSMFVRERIEPDESFVGQSVGTFAEID